MTIIQNIHSDDEINRHGLNKQDTSQSWIQDVRKVVPTYYFAKCLSKTVWKWKKVDRERELVFLGSANGLSQEEFIGSFTILITKAVIQYPQNSNQLYTLLKISSRISRSQLVPASNSRMCPSNTNTRLYLNVVLSSPLPSMNLQTKFNKHKSSDR